MSKKGSLFLLIKSLTKSEKRYFKLSRLSGKQDANYVLLFNFIDKQVQYDESAIREHFEGERFIKQLHVAKIYLTELILKSLRSYRAGSSINGQLLDLLADIEILFDKELYDSCRYRVAKAEGIAVQYEKSALLIEILGWRRRLLLAQSMTESDEKKMVIVAESAAIKDLSNLNEYWAKTLSIMGAAKDKGFVKWLNIDMATTLKARTLHHHLLYSYYFINGQPEMGVVEIEKLVLLLEAHPHRVEEDPSSYVTAVSNKISFLIRQKRYDEIPILILLMRSVPDKYKLKNDSKFAVRLWLRVFNLELELYRDTQQVAAAVAVIEEVKTYVNAHESGVPDEYRIMLYYQVTSLCFANRDFLGSLHWVNEIVNFNFGDTRTELQCYSRMLNLMVLFELENVIVLRYGVESCRRFLKKKKKISEFEKEFLLLFSRLSVAAKYEHSQVFRKAYDKMYSSSTEVDAQVEDCLAFKRWLNEKV